jgi:mannose-6-phosphate isomerase-like protein (cupin superfamily)
MYTATKPIELDLIAEARKNQAFRRVIETGEHAQVVLMTIPVGAQIGEEVHRDTDQIFIFVASHGEAILDGVASPVAANDLVFVRAGTRHNIVNHGAVELRVITIYAPPQHPAGTVHLTQAEAEADERTAG